MDSENTWSLPNDYLKVANVILPLTTEESLGTFYSEWTIDPWSSLEDKVHGPTFEINTTHWNMLLFPKGQQSISLYLENEECRQKTINQDICVQFSLCIVDPTNPTHFYHKESQHRFSEYEADWGFTQFIDMDELNEYMVEDRIKLATMIRIIKDPTGVLWHHFYNYDSKKMTGHVGLLNQGATCYMNSLFQSLFFTNPYRKAVFQIPTDHEEPTQSIALALQRIFYQLQYSNRAVSTRELTQAFGWDSMDSFMQHDIQEFNRLLQDTMEKKMQGTPAEDTIRKLFMGKIKSYIKCIHVDYESSRTEHFYDIQLNVKGCKDLYASFENYVQEEILKGENMYRIENGGLQEAKKGVVFESFPPVLHLQLKRFEYDMMRDTMVKINDRYEFPAEIDLKPYLDHDTTESYQYVLHGVLVHTGDLMGGHYFAFVRPSKEDQWYKFDDDRVTPCTHKEVLEDNYGGVSLYPVNTKRTDRVTNAYMLVYVRQSLQDDIFRNVTQEDIPSHLRMRIEEEEKVREEMERREAEKHLYMRAYITDDTSFLMNHGPDFVAPSEEHIQVRQVLRHQSLNEFLTMYAQEKGMEYFIWYIDVGTVRPIARLTNLAQSLEQVCEQVSSDSFLRFYMEPKIEGVQDSYLLFIKLFDPVTQSLRGIGKLYVSKDSFISNAQHDILVMAGLDPRIELELYKEVHPCSVELLNKDARWKEQCQDGSILCVQVRGEGDIKGYYHYLDQRVQVIFEGEGNEGIPMVVCRDMFYEQVLAMVGHAIGYDPAYLQLMVSPEKGIQPMTDLRLGDILQLLPRTPRCVWRLYYRVLPIRLTELKKKKLMKLYVCTEKGVTEQTVAMKRSETVGDLMSRIAPYEQPKRVFRVEHHLFEQEYQPNQVVGFIDGPIYIEMIPEEELQKGAEDFYIHVFHYEKELSRTHSIPFKFLVIKNEPFCKTKMRIQKRLGLNQIEFNKISFHIISKFITHIKEDTFILSNYSFKPEDLLGLNHSNPIISFERKLHIN